MKTLLIFLVLIVTSLWLPTQWATAGEDLRTSLSQKWKQVQNYQQSQNRKFKALEREAGQMTRERGVKTEAFRPAHSGSNDRRSR